MNNFPRIKRAASTASGVKPTPLIGHWDTASTHLRSSSFATAHFDSRAPKAGWTPEGAKSFHPRRVLSLHKISHMLDPWTRNLLLCLVVHAPMCTHIFVPYRATMRSHVISRLRTELVAPSSSREFLGDLWSKQELLHSVATQASKLTSHRPQLGVAHIGQAGLPESPMGQRLRSPSSAAVPEP